MRIEFEVNARRVLLTAACGLLGVFALHAAFPRIFGWWPRSPSDVASWVQAVGSIGAIVAVYLISSREKRWRDLERDEIAIPAAFDMELRLTELQTLAGELHTSFSLTRKPHPDILSIWADRTGVVLFPTAEAHAALRGVGPVYMKCVSRAAVSFWHVQRHVRFATDYRIAAPSASFTQLEGALARLNETVQALESARYALRNFLSRRGYSLDQVE